MDDNTPLHIKQAAESVIQNLLPEKSSNRYLNEYAIFAKWCVDNSVSTYNEYVLLAYFEARSKKLKSSTLWSMYSMLKSTLNIKHNINIETYTKLIAFLKRKRDGYEPKKSKVLQIPELEKFINEAPNENFLMIKTALIIGICAACRIHELKDMKIQDVRDRGDIIVITIPVTKTKKVRTSCVTDARWIDIIKKYIALRPKGTVIDRFFLFYAKNKCTQQPVGIHSFGIMPSKIASYLQLDNPTQYTGHCFRRSSATALAGNGVDISTLKRHGGWKSTTVAESYIEDSLGAKIAIANQFISQTTVKPQPSASSSVSNSQQATPQTSASSSNTQDVETNSFNMDNVQLQLNDTNLPNINLSHLQNCTINFNFK